MTKNKKLVSSLLSLGIAVAGVSRASAAANMEDPMYMAKAGEGYTRLFVGANSKDSVITNDPTVTQPGYGYQGNMLRLTGEVGHSFTDRFMLTLKMAYSGNYGEDRKGLHKANLEGLYRVVDGKIKFDVIGGFSFGGIMKSEADVTMQMPSPPNPGPITMRPRNYSYGMYGLVFGTRFGGNITDKLSVGALIEGTYRFSQSEGMKIDANVVGPAPAIGIINASFESLLDIYTQVATSYQINDKLSVNGKVSYQYYDGKTVKDVNVESASGPGAAAITAIANGFKGKDLNDSFGEYGFGASAMYSLTEAIQVGPYYEYLLGGHMSKGALDTNYRTEYGLKFNAKF
jgi:hypothetical protein